MLKYQDIIEKLTADQKIALVSSFKALGGNAFIAAGIPAVNYTGPRRINAACGYALPSFRALANSWDTQLMGEAASYLASRANDDGVNFMFTPPLRVCSDTYQNGLSEDPFLSEKYSEEISAGISKCGVFPCLEGCALNERDADYLGEKPEERTLYEYFLPPFSPYPEGGAIGIPYNSLSGAYAGINDKIEKYIASKGGYSVCTSAERNVQIQRLMAGDILWAGDESVVRNAYNNYLGMRDGIYKGECSEEELDEACKNGHAISEAALNTAADRIIALAFTCEKTVKQASFARSAGDIPLRAAEESIVLLKNDGVLPLAAECQIAVMGAVPLNGGGSAEMSFAESLLRGGRYSCVAACAGYDMSADRNDDLLDGAIAAAEASDTVVVFVGADEERAAKMTETRRVKLPANQLALLAGLSAAGKRIVAVLTGDIAFDMSFDRFVNAVIYAPCGCAQWQSALLNVISGDTTPSGRLATTMYDNSDEVFAHLHSDIVSGRIKVGPYIGYRSYSSAGAEVRYPFGYGLSYTTFSYHGLEVNKNKVTFTVKNTGEREGTEVVQLYAGKTDTNLLRPLKELVGFARVKLGAGQSQRLTFTIDGAGLRVFHGGKMVMQKGEYILFIGSSLQDIKLRARINLSGETFKVKEEQKSQYLQSESNILSGGYVFGKVKNGTGGWQKGLQRGKDMLLTGILLAVVVLVIAVFDVFSVGGVAYYLLIPALFIALVGALAIRANLSKKKKIAHGAKVIAEENMDDKKIYTLSPYEKLFKEAFDLPEKQPEKKKTTEESAVYIPDEIKYYDGSLPPGTACEKFRAYANDRGISIGQRDAAKLFASFASSRLIIAGGASELSSLFEVFCDFTGVSAYKESGGFESPEDFMYRMTESGYREKTAAALAAAEASSRKKEAHVVMVTDVEPSGIASFFMPFARYINFPSSGEKISLAEGGGSDKFIKLTPNIWFVLILKEGADISAADGYIAGLSAYYTANVTPVAASDEKAKTEGLSYYQLAGYGRVCPAGYPLDEEKGWKKVDKLEKFASANNIPLLNNRGWTRAERFSAVCLACGMGTEEALDSTVAATVIPAMAIACAANGKTAELADSLQGIFGEDSMAESKRALSGARAKGGSR